MPKKTQQKKNVEKSIVVRAPAKIPDLTYARPASYRNELNQWFEDVRNAMENRFFNPWVPASAIIDVREPSLDIIDNGKEFVIHAEMPGIPKEKIEINVTSTHLEISGKTEQKDEESGRDYVRQERTYSQFYRSTALPEDILPDKAQAKVHNGVLEIRLPKKTPTPGKLKHKVPVK